MIRNLHFIKAEPSISTQLVPGSGSQVQREDASGQMRPTGEVIGGKYTRVAEKGEYTHVQVRSEDVKSFMSTIAWYIEEPDIYFPMKPKAAGVDIVEIEIPGRFSPALTLDNVTEMISNWRLLSGHFLKFEDIFSEKHMSKWLIPAMNHLLNKATNKESGNMKWIREVLRIQTNHR